MRWVRWVSLLTILALAPSAGATPLDPSSWVPLNERLILLDTTLQPGFALRDREDELGDRHDERLHHHNEEGRGMFCGILGGVLGLGIGHYLGGTLRGGLAWLGMDLAVVIVAAVIFFYINPLVALAVGGGLLLVERICQGLDAYRFVMTERSWIPGVYLTDREAPPSVITPPASALSWAFGP